MSNHSSGHDAEVLAANYLRDHSFKVIELNWKTKYCEIDIVSRKGKVLYFIEVKSRITGAQGTALEYITPAKLNQMSFAAEMWVNEHDWTGEYQLAAVGIDDGDVTFIERIDL